MNHVLRRRLLRVNSDTFCRLLQQAFPGSEWAPTIDASSGPDSSTPVLPPQKSESEQWLTTLVQAPQIALVGAASFDRGKLEQWLGTLPPETVIVTGDERGAEKAAREIVQEQLRVDVPALDPSEPPTLNTRKAMLERLDSAMAYGKARKAGSETLYGSDVGKAQVESILSSTAGRIALIGSGGRVTSARSWLKRMRSDREVIEIP